MNNPLCTICRGEIVGGNGVYEYNTEEWFHHRCKRIAEAHDSFDGFQDMAMESQPEEGLDIFKDADIIAGVLKLLAVSASALRVKLSDIASSILLGNPQENETVDK